MALRDSGVQLWSMSSNGLPDQINLIKLIQTEYPLFQFDVIWQTGGAGSSTGLAASTGPECRQILTIAPRGDGEDIRGNGKEGIRAAYETVGLISATAKSRIVVLDDGKSVISKAQSEGYLTHTFFERTAEDAFQALFQITDSFLSPRASATRLGAPVTVIRDIGEGLRTPLLGGGKPERSCCVVM